jgi:hypothetical protein
MSVAAKILGCTRQTIYNASLRWKTVRDEIASQRERVVDLAEQKLIDKLNASEWPAIKYTLSTLGKDRGYGPEVEPVAAIEFIVKYDKDDTDRDQPEEAAS